MATPPTVEGLYSTAVSFAQTTLDAHHEADRQRVAVDAGTALEHLTKACLGKRSLTLLTELKTSPTNWLSLVALAGLPEGKPTYVRTVGLREAVTRARTFFTSPASIKDLDLLIDLRDGVVHAALDEPLEERLLVAFVQQADATLADMGLFRAGFWGDRIGVVDALLADASDKVAYRVTLKLATAEAAFEKRYGQMQYEVLAAVRVTRPDYDDSAEALAVCPACGSQGVAEGELRLEADGEWDEDGGHSWETVFFTPAMFACGRCGLRLESVAELAAAGFVEEWDLPDFDASLLREDPDDWAYDQWREAHPND